jgi:hypothetical protein
MRMLSAALFCLGIACAPALAGDSAEERAFFIAAFQTAREYGADMSLLSYCFRHDEETSARVTLGVIADLGAVFERVRQGALDERRSAEFFRETLAAIRFASRDASDPALDKACEELRGRDPHCLISPLEPPCGDRRRFSSPKLRESWVAGTSPETSPARTKVGAFPLSRCASAVLAGLVPAIHVFAPERPAASLASR